MNVRMAGRYWFGRVGPSGYGFYTTAEQVAADHGAAVSGRVVLVTGAASGIGLETASVFAAHGATVFVTARSADKAEAAAKAVRARVPGANVRTLAIDLSNLKDVKRAANEFLALKSPLHILVNNAGVMVPPFSKTVDGIENQFATNHMGHYALTMHLLPALKASAPARVVVVASLGYGWAEPKGVVYPGRLDAPETYDAFLAYGRSKLANVLFARSFNQRYAKDGVTAYSLHPGIIPTELSRHMGVMARVSDMITRMIGKTIPQGAATSVFCAVSDHAVPGEYHDESNVEMTSFHPLFRDQGHMDAIWALSEKLMREKLGD